MKRLLENTIASLSFIFVFFLHIYFALIMTCKPALAQSERTTSLNNSTTTEQMKDDEKSQEESAENVTDDDDDEEVQIRVNLKDGVSIKGGKKIIAELKDLERKIDKKNKGYTEIDVSTGAMLVNSLVPISFFLTVFGFAAYTIHTRSKTRREYLETIKILAKDGKPIPPELLAGLNQQGSFLKNNWNSFDHNNPGSLQGLKYIFVGIGLLGTLVLLDKGYTAAGFSFMFIVWGAYHIVKSQNFQKKELSKSNDENKNTSL
ncbi:MAG: hypothetical protein H6623_09225 [Bdellovibrionaceae bacterium]|nr:hypothetical protein [Pseudobdellovibrionaceae bacterium]